MTISTSSDPWHGSRRTKTPALTCEQSPPESLLLALRGRVENGCPFEVARQACGVPTWVHEAWLARGLAIHDAQPDRLYHERGIKIAGSLEPEAEYARIVTTMQAGVAADVIGKLYDIAKDPGRKQDQLKAITLILRGLGIRQYDPRSEQDVNVTADVAPTVDQSVIDAMTPEQRIALRDRARAASRELAKIDTDLAEAAKRSIAADSSEPIDMG